MAIELKTGKMTSQELAQWFGVSYGTFRNKKEQRLEELKKFADFEPYHGGVDIKEVLIPVYSKKIEDDLLYYNMVLERANRLGSGSGFANYLVENDPNYAHLTVNQVSRRMNKSKVRNFGAPGLGEGGVYGTCKYIWAIKLSEDGDYRLLSDYERDILSLLQDEYQSLFKKGDQEVAKYRKLYESQKITAEEFAKYTKPYNYFSRVIQKFRDQTGCQIALATYHHLYSEETAPAPNKDDSFLWD